MMLKLSDITTLTLFMVGCLLLSSDGLHVERGDQDIFETPSCSDSGGSSCTCYQLNADCVRWTNCTRCQCWFAFPTFHSSSDKHGRCVGNAGLNLIPDNSTESSFLVQNKGGNLCIAPSSSNNILIATKCDQNDPTQWWELVRDGQLLHMESLECLEPTGRYTSFPRYRLSLKACLGDLSDSTHQKWKCDGQDYFEISYPQKYRYMWYDNTLTVPYISLKRVTNNRENVFGIMWQRLRSRESLCSKYSEVRGCDTFTDSTSTESYLLVVDINCTASKCEGSKQINFKKVLTKAKCSVMWKQSQLLQHNNWKQLSLTERIFKISVTDHGYGKLEWNFTDASSKWSGLIVKLHFECQKPSEEMEEPYTGCVMIKFKGTPMLTPTKPVTATVTVSPTQTMPTGQTTLTDTPSSSSKTNEPTSAYKSTNQTSNDPDSEEQQKNESSNVVTIVVCSVVAILISFAILGFIFYKRRFRNSPKSSSEADIQGDSSTRQSSADTRNPIYSPAENSYASPISNNDQLYQEPEAGASRECELYESSENNTHDYATLEKDVKLSPVREETYDYAKNDDIRSAALQMHPKSNSRQDNRNVSSDLEENKIGDADTTPVYQTLEDPYKNV